LSSRSTDLPDGLAGRELVDVRLGGPLVLAFAGPVELAVHRILSTHAEGAAWAYPADIQCAPQLGRLVGRRVSGVELLASGALRIGLGDAEVRAEPSPQAESWQLTGPDGRHLRCLAGGRVVHGGPGAPPVPAPAGQAPVRGRIPAAEVTLYGLFRPGRADPAGIARRRVIDGGVFDQHFTRALRWDHTTGLVDVEFGYSDRQYAEISVEQAEAYVRRLTERLSG
jgi:Family of unknown function (DUF6188)